VQRDALFNKSERQVAESQLATVQQQLADLQAQSIHIQELHKGIQESQGLVKEKDRKVRVHLAKHLLFKPLWSGHAHASVSVQITELSKEMFRLKEALGALSPPLGITSNSSSSSPHHGNPGQQVALQNRIAILTQQLQVSRALTRGTCEVYRAPSIKTTKQTLKSSRDKKNFFNPFFLQDWEKKHKQVVTVYRTHLLAAVQVRRTHTFTRQSTN